MKLTRILASDPAQAGVFRSCLQANQPYRLLELKLYVTRRCNLRCCMCNAWNGAPAGKRNELNTQELYRIIDEARALGLQKLRLFGGEPLLRSDLDAVIRHASPSGVQVFLTTNGSLLSQNRVDSLLDAGLSGVDLSIDAQDARLHDDVRGLTGAWDRLVNGMACLRESAGRLGSPLRIGVNTVVMRQNYLELPVLGRWLAGLGVDAWTLIPVTPQADNPRSRANDYMLREEDLRRYNREVLPRLWQDGSIRRMSDLQGLDIFGSRPEDHATAAEGRYVERLGVDCCYKPWYYTVVRENGDVLGCNTVKDSVRHIGNLRASSLVEIWSSAAYAGFRSRCKPPRMPGCERCCYHIALRNLRITRVVSAG